MYIFELTIDKNKLIIYVFYNNNRKKNKKQNKQTEWRQKYRQTFSSTTNCRPTANSNLLDDKTPRALQHTRRQHTIAIKAKVYQWWLWIRPLTLALLCPCRHTDTTATPTTRQSINHTSTAIVVCVVILTLLSWLYVCSADSNVLHYVSSSDTQCEMKREKKRRWKWSFFITVWDLAFWVNCSDLTATTGLPVTPLNNNLICALT